MLVWLATAVLDALVVGALAWLVRGLERRHARASAAAERRLARLQGSIEALMADVERRVRTLDHALAMREATLRVLVEAATPSAPMAPLLEGAAVRVLRDLELSLDPPSDDPIGPTGAVAR